MPKVVKNKSHNSKTIFVEYGGDVTWARKFNIASSDSDTDIVGKIRKACGGLLQGPFSVVDDNDHHIRISYQYFRHDGKYKAVPSSGAEKTKTDPRAAKLEKIVAFWGLGEVSDIFPSDFAFKPSEQPWSDKFVVALWKLSKDTPGAHKLALEILKEVTEKRYKDKSNVNFGVEQLLTSDILRAVDSSQDFAKKLVETAVEVDERVNVEAFAGGLVEGIQEIEEEIEVEDGTTLGNLSL